MHAVLALCSEQERERELTEQLAATAGSVVGIRAQLGSAQAEAAQLRAQTAELKEDYRRAVVRLDDQACGSIVRLISLVEVPQGGKQLAQCVTLAHGLHRWTS